METNQKQCLVVEVKELSLEENPVVRIPVKEGKNLSNSVTEDVFGFSLMPEYSLRQLRAIRRIQIKSSGNGAQTKSAKQGWGRVATW